MTKREQKLAALAINGGPKARETPLPARAAIGKEEKDVVVALFDNALFLFPFLLQVFGISRGCVRAIRRSVILVPGIDVFVLVPDIKKSQNIRAQLFVGNSNGTAGDSKSKCGDRRHQGAIVHRCKKERKNGYDQHLGKRVR